MIDLSNSNIYQQTISEPIIVKGIGLHSGINTIMRRDINTIIIIATILSIVVIIIKLLYISTIRIYTTIIYIKLLLHKCYNL